MGKLKRKGQSTLEYVVVLLGIIAAIIAGLIWFAPRDGSRGIGQMFNQAAVKMETSTQGLATIAN